MKTTMMTMLVVAMVGCGGTMDEAGTDGMVSDSSVQLEYSKHSGGSTTTTTTTTASTALRSTAEDSMSASTAAWSTSFPITTTPAVYFAFDVKVSSGHHTERLYLYNQRGALYQEIQVSFAAGVTAGANEQGAQSLGGGSYRIWASLPVSGTAIDFGWMAGSWSAQAFLDSSRKANVSMSFELN